MCVETCGDGKVQRITRQLGGTAKFFPTGNRDRAMLLRKFVDPRRGLFRQVRRRLAAANSTRATR